MNIWALAVPILSCLTFTCTSDRQTTKEGNDLMNIAIDVHSFHHEGHGVGDGDDNGDEEELKIHGDNDENLREVSVEEWSTHRDSENRTQASREKISGQFWNKPMYEFWFTATAFQSIKEMPDTPKALTAQMAKVMFSSAISISDLVKTWPSVLYQDYIGDRLWNIGMDPAQIAISMSLLRALYPPSNDLWQKRYLTREILLFVFSMYVTEFGSDLSRWMKAIARVDKDLFIRDLLMPGVHDAGCYEALAIPGTLGLISSAHWECQSHPTTSQLRLGARVFDWRIGLRIDLRPAPKKTAQDLSDKERRAHETGFQDLLWTISHKTGVGNGMTGWFRSFYDELNELLTWCNKEENSGELVIIRLKRNSGRMQAYEVFLQRLLSEELLGDEFEHVAVAKRLLHQVRSSDRLLSGKVLEGKTVGDLQLKDLNQQGGCTLALTLYKAKFSDSAARFIIAGGALWRDLHLFGRYSGSKVPVNVVAGQLLNLDKWRAATDKPWKPPPLKRGIVFRTNSVL